MKKLLFVALSLLWCFPAFGQIKISGLPAATTPLAGTEIVPLVQGGVTKQTAVNNLLTTGGFDSLLCATQGAILYRNATTWVCLSPGTSGQVLQTQGAAANPQWGNASAGTVTTTGSPANGNLTKFSGSASITNGDLSGDVTTSGALATTIKSSVALGGNPTTTTQSASDNSTKIATTAYVDRVGTGAAGGSLAGNYPNPTIASSVSLPGSPTTTTQSAKDNSTKVATTAYVDNPTGLTAGTSVTLAAPRQYFVCTSTCTITMPVPAVGYEFCVFNDDNVSTVITFAAIGSSARYENTARTAYGTAGTGTAVSGGAVGDKLCLVGRDSTHYVVGSSTGTWTMN